jgi:hypothetical protein
MSKGRHIDLSNRIESANATVDGIVSRFHPDEEQRVRIVEKENEVRVLRFFPYIVAMSVIAWVAILIINNDYSLGYMIMDLCLVFVFVFTVLGIILFPLSTSGPFPKVMVVLVAVILALLQWMAGQALGVSVYIETADKILGALGIYLSDPLLDIATIVAVFFVTLFTCYGVLSVTVSYLRTDLSRVFLSMQKNAIRGTRGKAEKFFQVPDIIDVKEIVLEPEINPHNFDLRLMIDMMWSNILLGITISSYLFINPLFLETIDVKLLVSIMVLLSMFVPILVVIWLSVRTVGAKAVSDAPRPFYLWTGAKRKLMYSFFALGAFAVMLWLSLYYGHSLLTIIETYVSFIIPLVMLSIMFSFAFVNNYSDPLKVSVHRRFTEGKEKLNGLKREEERSALFLLLARPLLLLLAALQQHGDAQGNEEHDDRDDRLRDIAEDPIGENQADDTEDPAEPEHHCAPQEDHESDEHGPHEQVGQHLRGQHQEGVVAHHVHDPRVDVDAADCRDDEREDQGHDDPSRE